jgi:hypothetical protein
MPIGPIRYLTIRELIEQAYSQSQHPGLRLLYASLLTHTASGAEEEQAVVVTVAISELMHALCALSQDLTCRTQHPALPADPTEQARMLHEGYAELVQWWGYEDITEHARRYYAEDAQAAGKPSLFDYQYVLQSSHSVSYVRSLADLLIVLDKARQAAHSQQTHREEAPDA